MSKFIIAVNLTILYFVMIVSLFTAIETENKKMESIPQNEEVKIVEEVESIALVEHEIGTEALGIEPNEELNSPDDYLLAKIAMAEAEGCSLQTKCFVIMTILNRVKSDKFPNTIEEVIFQKNENTYQFTPVGNGRWQSVEPNEECWEAVENVLNTKEDCSQGALFFESCVNEDNWHSRNLTFLFNSDGMRFYKP